MGGEKPVVVSGEVVKSPELAKVSKFRESHGPTRRLRANVLTADQPLPDSDKIPTTIHQDVLTAIDAGSLAERQKHNEGKGNWGEQMRGWMGVGSETEGMDKWVGAQRQIPGTEATQKILAEVGFIADVDQLKTEDSPVMRLLGRINKDLEGARKQIEDATTLTDEERQSALVKVQEVKPTDLTADQWGALNFYAQFLDVDPTKPHNEESQTHKLAQALLKGASQGLAVPEAGQPDTRADEIFKRLDGVAPLLRTKGDKAQHAVALVIAAQVHGQHEGDKVQNATDEIKPHEKPVLDWIQSHKLPAADQLQRQDPNGSNDGLGLPPPASENGISSAENKAKGPTGLELGKTYALTDIFKRVEAKATPDQNEYFITGSIPTPDIVYAALQAQKEGLQALEQAEPYWKEGQHPDISIFHLSIPNFAPAIDFRAGDNPNSERFGALGKLTYSELELFPLAGVAAESPDKQAEVFRTVATMVLEVHRNSYKNNQDLVTSFLDAQFKPESPENYSFKNFIDAELARPFFLSLQGQVMDLYRKYDINTSLSKSEIDMQVEEIRKRNGPQYQQFIQEYNALISSQGETKGNYLLLPLDKAQDRLIAFYINEEDGSLRYDELLTAQQWKERIMGQGLEEAIRVGSMTPEQIHQINFLAHSVDIEQVMKVIKALANGETMPDHKDDSASPDATGTSSPLPATDPVPRHSTDGGATGPTDVVTAAPAPLDIPITASVPIPDQPTQPMASVGSTNSGAPTDAVDIESAQTAFLASLSPVPPDQQPTGPMPAARPEGVPPAAPFATQARHQGLGANQPTE